YSGTPTTPEARTNSGRQRGLGTLSELTLCHSASAFQMIWIRPWRKPQSRWEQAVYDAELFLAEWGSAAERLGWTADDLFGLHPTVPLSRVDCMDALWLCKGERVAELTETTARFERGLAFYRRARNTGAAP